LNPSRSEKLPPPAHPVTSITTAIVQTNRHNKRNRIAT